MNGILRNKRLVRWVLGAVFIADLALAGINWRIATAPRPDRSALNLLQAQEQQLAKDVARGQVIQKELPGVEQQCDKFLQEQLPSAGTGYSSVVDNLGAVARTAGLRTENVNFRQHEADKHGIIVVEIAETVNGDYSSVVRFINGLEHAPNFYVLDELSLAQGSAGNLRLNLRLRTYFRT
jgi:Tfp pilus assembly protein PilO